jgi:hypothetical protein
VASPAKGSHYDGVREIRAVVSAGIAYRAAIALATLTGCDVIVSWKFAHIVNFKAMTAVDAVNTLWILQRHSALPPDCTVKVVFVCINGLFDI